MRLQIRGVIKQIDIFLDARYKWIRALDLLYNTHLVELQCLRIRLERPFIVLLAFLYKSMNMPAYVMSYCIRRTDSRNRFCQLLAERSDNTPIKQSVSVKLKGNWDIKSQEY